jgi:hypothetical protein
MNSEEAQDIRLRRIISTLEDARTLGYGSLTRTHTIDGTVTMFFEGGELTYSLPDGWDDGG